jgi:hypothetical protein
MKKIVCDTCGSENARTYRYSIGKDTDPSGNGYNTNWKYIDLCLNCVQDWVLKNQKKLSEVTNETNSSNKKVIHG